jgi:hypothetical protein
MRGRAHTAAWSRGTEGKTRTRAADHHLTRRPLARTNFVFTHLFPRDSVELVVKAPREEQPRFLHLQEIDFRHRIMRFIGALLGLDRALTTKTDLFAEVLKQRHTARSVSPRERNCLSITDASCRPDGELVLDLFLDPGESSSTMSVLT